MGSVCVDPSSMVGALSQLVAFHAELAGAASVVREVVVPAGVPSDLRGQVESALGQAQADLTRAARSIEALPEEMRRRIKASKMAEGDDAAIGASLATGMFSSFGDMLDKTVGETNAPALVRDAGPILEQAGDVAGFALGLRDSLADPTLSTGQKITRPVTEYVTGAAVAESASTLAAAVANARTGAMLGAEVGGPYGAVAGAAAAALWTVADSKLHISDKIADVAAPVVDVVAHPVEKAVDNFRNGINRAIHLRIR